MAVGGEGGVKVRLEKLSLDTDQGILEDEHQKWGLTLKEVYRLGLSFYKDKEGKALHLSYEDKLKLIAYTQQAIHGPLNEKTAPPLGVLDVIGRDRRSAWLELGNMSQTQAMVGFTHMLDRLCPLFKTYVEANRKDSDEKQFQKNKLEEESKELAEIQKNTDQEQRRLQQQKASEEEQVRRVKDALNEQTYEQFLQYAEQQFPGNPDQQAVLVRQLQDQHYHQYIQQLALNRQEAASAPATATATRDTNKEIQTESEERPEFHPDEKNHIIQDNLSHNMAGIPEKHDHQTEDNSHEPNEDSSQSDEGVEDSYVVASPSMWTRTGLAQFKQAVRNAAGGGGVLQVGHGETLTVRVPTHEGGRCLFWEFATDNFDIGFGVFFEWSKSPTTQVTVHVAESDDEGDLEGEDFDDEDEIINIDDLEGGSDLVGTTRSALSMLKAPVSIVIPIYRRDSHLEIYAGSHAYPGEGVYLLKFDNTFSLWRSKTLFYRVYYTR